MPGPFRVSTTSHFDRLAKALRKRHRQEFVAALTRAVDILRADPHNTTGQYPLRKLVDAHPGQGQFRLRIGRFRFRYNVTGEQHIILVRCSLRRKDTYR